MNIRIIILLFSTFLISSTCFAQIPLTDKTESIIIGKQIFVLLNPALLNNEGVIASKDFQLSEQEVPNLGIQKHAVWLKFSVVNNSNSDHFLLNLAYPIIDSVELIEVNSSNDILGCLKQGEGFKFYPRKYDFPNFIFDISIKPSETKFYYLKIKSAEQLILPISIEKPSKLWEKLSRENSLSGIFLGVVLIMFFYNLFLFFSTKDKGYLYYVIYVLFVGFTQLGIKGYTYQYLWPNSPIFQAKSIVVFACVSCIAALLFAEHFLKLKSTAPKGRLFVYVLHGLFSISLILAAFVDTQIGFQMMLTTTTLGTLILIVLSFYVMVKGYEPAKYFFAAWSVLLAGSIIFLLKDYGVLPFNLYTSYSFQAASALEMALLSFGLANSINILKKEKEISQLQALNAAQENEKIIREQNIVLEQKVEERTHELSEKNDDLQTTLEDLKQAQSQLVEAEKMASLGQLTAGIAHEINNPINFVTSNVTPLKRDVGMVFDTIEFIESLAYTDLTIEERKTKIEAFKEELDYDYLKTEIDHLLNGIYEGSSRTAEIVKGLRIFSRVDENDLKRADINEGLDSTLIIVNNLLNGTIQIVKDYAQNLPLIECYPGKLNQVFLNIISNAIYAVRKKHNESGNALITIRTRSFDQYITIEILDNGTGMDEVTQRKIYEPFFTTKEVGEGTGLGMSIVYNTVKKHNGTIKLVSKMGEGTSFVIQLPINFDFETNSAIIE